MEYEKYTELIKDVEIYFAKIIKNRFKEYIDKHYSLHFAPDIQSHQLIGDLLENDGFDVFGMNVNMDGFQLLLDFKSEYLNIDNFLFTRLVVDFNNDGNYTVYLDESSFDDDWTAYLEDDWDRYYSMNEVDLVRVLNDIKKLHLMLMLKN